MLLIFVLFLHHSEVKQEYVKWTADRTTLEIRFSDDPSPVIEIDQQEYEVSSCRENSSSTLCFSGKQSVFF